MTFYNMMILEGFIAMVWAGAAMGVLNGGLAAISMLHNAPTSVVGIVAKNMLGSVGGMIAVIGVIVLPVTTGDTALRALRIMAADALHVDTGKRRNNLLIALPIFAIVAGMLYFSKSNANGFNLLWRYFAWSNETTAVFAFTMISVYMIKTKKPYLMALVPGMFYLFIVLSFILNAKIGFHLSWTLSYVIAGIAALAYGAVIAADGKNQNGAVIAADGKNQRGKLNGW